MQAISKGLEKVVQELTASENDGPVSETFCKVTCINYFMHTYLHGMTFLPGLAALPLE